MNLQEDELNLEEGDSEETCWDSGEVAEALILALPTHRVPHLYFTVFNLTN